MPKISNVELLKKNNQPTLFIRTRTKVEDLPRLIGESYGKLGAYLQEMDELLTDVPYVAYHNMDMQDLDVEIGFPVPTPLSGSGDIQSGVIPGGLMVFSMYLGSYSEIEPLYMEMAQWIKDHGYEATGVAYEYYYNDMQS
ncbi:MULTISPECIES: GyrI-like domain-containing protein [Bacillus]|uniref:GyrI-like domain-containing protein n=1 Tax=Bacillus TaxID=1386 RepID=UPI00030B4279|nr:MULTISPECIES: GyrI-like domain-containing protein [Bacillus]